MDRRLDADLSVHVAARGAAQHRHAFAAQAELMAGLCAGRDRHLGARAIDRRHFDRAAERRCRHRDRHAAMNVRAVALEERMRPDGKEDVEIAIAAAAQTRFAFAGETDTRAVLDTGRNGDVEHLLLARAALAAARTAWLVDHLAGAMTGRAGALHGEEALLRADAAGAAAGRAIDRLRSCFRAAAVTGITRRERRHADLRLASFESFLERDLEIVAEIAAAIIRAAATAAAHHRAEHLLEDVGEAAGAAEAEIAAAATALFESGMAEAVVSGALLIVLQDVIGLVNILEAVLGLFVARIAVGMILHGELTERLLDVVARGITPHAEQLIEVLFRHRNYLVPRLRTPGASTGEVATGSPWKMRPSLPGAFSGEVATGSPWKMRPSLQRETAPAGRGGVGDWRRSINPNRASYSRRPPRSRRRPLSRRPRQTRCLGSHRLRLAARPRPPARLAACTSPRRSSSRLAPGLRSSSGSRRHPRRR